MSAGNVDGESILIVDLGKRLGKSDSDEHQDGFGCTVFNGSVEKRGIGCGLLALGSRDGSLENLAKSNPLGFFNEAVDAIGMCIFGDGCQINDCRGGHRVEGAGSIDESFEAGGEHCTNKLFEVLDDD